MDLNFRFYVQFYLNFRPLTGLGPPETGSALKPDAVLEMTALDSVDEMREDDSEFLQCIKRLYNCQNAGIARQDCENVELCSVEDRKLPEEPIQGGYLPPSGVGYGLDLGESGLRPPYSNTRPTVSSTFTTTQTIQSVSKPTNRKFYNFRKIRIRKS